LCQLDLASQGLLLLQLTCSASTLPHKAQTPSDEFDLDLRKLI